MIAKKSFITSSICMGSSSFALQTFTKFSTALKSEEISDTDFNTLIIPSQFSIAAIP